MAPFPIMQVEDAIAPKDTIAYLLCTALPGLGAVLRCAYQPRASPPTEPVVELGT